MVTFQLTVESRCKKLQDTLQPKWSIDVCKVYQKVRWKVRKKNADVSGVFPLPRGIKSRCNQAENAWGLG